MPSFYELLKYAKTGIASPDMTAYDKMKALAMAGGAKYPVNTITGVPPISFKSDGTPLISWSMLGNGQPGEPPTFCGVRTANLWNFTILQGGWYAASGTIPTPAGPGDTNYDSRCRTADIIPIPSNTMSITCQSDKQINCVWLDANGVSMGGSGWQQSGSTVTAPENAVSLTFILAKIDGSICVPNDFQNIMLVNGSTPLPYEPPGYKIHITCAGQTTAIYIGAPLRKAIDGSDAVDILYSTGTITRAVDADGNALATPTTQTIDVPPEIQTVRGSNVLMVDTDLPPSSASITGHIKPV